MEFLKPNLYEIENDLHRCELIKAKSELIRLLARTQPFENSQDRYEILILLLETLAEQQDFEMISQVQSELKIESQNQQSQNDRTFYIFALCAAYQKSFEEALNYCELSVQAYLSVHYNLTKKNSDQLVLTLAGRLACFVKLNRFEEAFKTLDHLDLMNQSSTTLNSKIAVELNAADLISRTGDQNRAWKRLEKARDLIRSQKSILNHIKFTIIGSEILERSGQFQSALEYLNHADSLCDPKELGFRSQRIQENILRLKNLNSKKTDLIINENSSSIIEKTLGQRDLGQQHLVQTLLSCLAAAQGEPVSKTEICRSLWTQDYNPRLHDNKIYVTVKRLRSLVEPDPKNPRYIRRVKGGYCLENLNPMFKSVSF